MKQYQFIFILLLCIGFCNCYEKEDIKVTELPYKREQMYDTTSNNKIIKFISQYYYKYDRFFITDPDSSDYLYNFKEKNKALQVTPPVQDEEHLWEGILTIKTLLLDHYNPEFIRKYFPYSIILTDHISIPGLFGNMESNYYTGRYFSMFKIQNQENMDQEEKIKVSGYLHEQIWTFIATYEDVITLSEKFYQFGEKLYGTDYPMGYFTQEELYEQGFIDNAIPDEDYFIFPTKGQDIGQWIRFLIITPEHELQEIIKTYNVMQIKYNYLVEALKKMGIDYTLLKYKE